MYNLYQSKLRKDIQHEVYRKPMFTVELFGKEYFWSIKEKKIWPFTSSRYQIMGVTLPDDQACIQKELAKLRKSFRKKWIFLQLGIVNEIVCFQNSMKRCSEFNQDMHDFRLGVQKILHNNCGLQTAFRENMPTASIVYDTTKTDEELLKDMDESCRKRVKKAIAWGMEFRIIDRHFTAEFFEKRQLTAGAKGFNTISKTQYDRLLEYIEKGHGMLIWAYLENKMIAWTICLFTDKMIYCPYGFYDREYNKIWVQHFLKFKLFTRAREHDYRTVDTGGGAPTGFPKHPLASVSAFKKSLGGTKTELYGSYDIVLNRFQYWLFKLRYKIRG